MSNQPLLIELHFLPCLEYICILIANKDILLEGQESYLKGSYRNKSKIVTANGIQTLSIPLIKGKHQQKNIQAVEISYVENWQRQHWRSLKTAYQSAPFWEDYCMDVEPLIMNKCDTLWAYNIQLLEGLIALLQLNVALTISTEYEKHPVGKLDLRNKISPKNKSWSNDKIKTIAYSQVFEDRQAFMPNASILDLLFCKGPESSLILEDMLI